MNIPGTMTRAELAAELQHTPAWLSKYLDTLYAAGMPRPKFGRGRGARWCRVAFFAWLRGTSLSVDGTDGRDPSRQPSNPIAPVDQAAEQEARDRRGQRAEAIGAQRA